MNICFFGLNLPEYSGSAMPGGMERAMSLLANELRRRGHRVDFYSFSSIRRPPRIPGVSVLLRALFPSLFNRTTGVHFREFLKKQKTDLIVWHDRPWEVPFSLKNLPCKLITICHNRPGLICSQEPYADHIIKRLKIRSRLGKRLVCIRLCRYLLRSCHNLVRYIASSYTLCHSDKLVLLSERFIPEFAPAKKFPEKVCATPNIAPFGVQSIDFSSKKKELLWLGRMDFNQKRPDYMLRIWQKLQDRLPDWSLRFVGDGEYLPELKALAKELGVQRVFFEGFQAPPPYYRSAPIFCMTSAYEGFGLVLVEAQAFGCVPVAFESFGAVRDIIEDGVNGVLVPPFDLDAYAEKLAELMSNPELRARLASAAQKSIAKFSSEAIGDKWGKLLREVVGGNP